MEGNIEIFSLYILSDILVSEVLVKKLFSWFNL